MPYQATVTIHTDRPRFPVAPHLYGLFIEEINRAGDGGLLAEQVRNRRFQDAEVPARCRVEGTNLISPTGWVSPFPEAPGSLPGWTVEGPASVKPVAGGGAVLEASGPCALVNAGFWGVNARPGPVYRLRVLADRLPASAEIRSAAGAVLASAPVIARGAGEGGADLEVPASDPEAVLVLRFAAGTTALQWVSLVPSDTWRGRRDGLRADLVQTLAGLRPRFLRFPGGCFVEGFTMETASRWKETIGPVEDRRGQWTLWQYRTTNGLGFHEYLVLAEDLNMAPLFVVNCGLSCQGRPGETVALDALGPWIQDMLDAVEYANGPVDSPWGRRRAQAGHPEPFGLKWVEIGNENFGGPYWERYRIFEKALKDAYPDIQTIFNVHWEEGSDTRGLKADLIDEHFYPDGEYFRLYHDLYDGYDRRGPRVYLGEYAQTVDNAAGTLAGALNEAAFLTGVERNQDLVVLTSYAPLLAHVNHAVWNPDLIYFDGQKVYLTPSYYVQQLFGTHRGETVVEYQIEGPHDRFDPRGAAAIEARYAPLFSQFCAEPAGDEDPAAGAALVVGPEGLVRRGRTDSRHSTVRVKLTVPAGGLKPEACARLRFLNRGPMWPLQNYFQWELDGGESRLVHINGWSRAQTGPTAVLPLVPGRTYDLEVTTDDGHLVCRLDGQVVHDHTIPAIPRLFTAVTLDRDGRELVVKLVNPGAEAADVSLDVRGTLLEGSFWGTELTAGHPSATNVPGGVPPVVPRPLDPTMVTFGPRGAQVRLGPWSLVVVRLPLV